MTNPIKMFLPVDKTGLASTNMVIDEEHSLPETGKILKLNYTAYYTNSIVVIGIDESNVEHPLTKSIDYKCTEHLDGLSRAVGKEICGSLLISDGISYRDFKVTYQAYGGNTFINNYELIHKVFNEPNKSLVKYADILDRPKAYNPSYHQHDALDIYGLEYVVKEINYINYTINNMPKLHQYNLGNRIEALFDKYPIITTDVHVDKDHLSEHLNIHQLTKDQIGLGIVENYGLLTAYSTGANGSYYLDYVNTATVNYVSNSSTVKFINESLSIKHDEYFGLTSFYNIVKANVDDCNNRADTLLSNVNSLQTPITTLNNITTDTVNKETSIYNSLKKYKHVKWNYELSQVVNFILLDKFTKTGGFISVPSKFDNLYLWLDLADSSTITTDTATNNKVLLIKDKSINGRHFIAGTDTSPRLISNNNAIANNINRNFTCLFESGKSLKLDLTYANISLNNEYTVIALVKNYTSHIELLNNGSNTISINNGSAVKINTGNMTMVSDIQNIPNNNTSIINLSVSLYNTNESWLSISNKVNNSSLGINNISSIISGIFNVNEIGNRLQTDQNFELAELIVYNRQLSTSELSVINKYLSMKWASSTDFPIRLDIIENNI